MAGFALSTEDQAAQALGVDIDQKRVRAFEVPEETDSNRTHSDRQSACLSVREGLGDDLKRIVVNHVSDSRFGEHHDGMTVVLQDSFDLMHAGQMVGGSVLEPRNSARLSAVEALRFRSVEPGWRFQVFLKPRKVLNQHVSVRDFHVRRISKLVRQGKGAILNA